LEPSPPPSPPPPPPPGKGDTGAADSSFGAGYRDIVAMSETERVEHLNEDKKRLDRLITQRPRQEERVTEALVEVSRDAALINHATILDAMHLADDEAKKHTQSLVDSTNSLVRSSTQLISTEIFNDELMNTLVAKSNGTVIQHMTRVFLNGLAFLTYYNEQVSTSSIINKLRVAFERDRIYKKFYSGLLPHLDERKMGLERVFLGGMRAIPEASFLNWATGFLIHDIGKASAVEYHEGEAAYNRDIVVEHVKLGYTSVMTKTNYSRDAGLITGYHHEYYGDPGGYGYFRSYLEQYKKANPTARQDYCISYELEPMIDFQALGFFPAKALEIVDIYDSVTDPNRKYRKALEPEEALSMMKEEFIDKHRKIDLILFEIFSRFVRERLPKAA
jgi:HD-GYP domain-containing protein (c-di-GMP phosphodiesterase class II)